MPFFKSLSNELGRNTGKYISGKVFGTGKKSTPQYVIDQQDRDERRKEREKIRREREETKEQARIERERAREERKLALEHAKLEKEELKRRKEEEKERVLQENRDLFSQFVSYIFSIEKLHTKTSFEVGFRSTQGANVSEPNVKTEEEIFKKTVKGVLSTQITDLTDRYKGNQSNNQLLKGLGVFEKFLILSSSNSDAEKYGDLGIPKYLKYLRNVKSDREKIKNFLRDLENHLLGQSTISIKQKSKNRLFSIVESSIKTGKKDINKKISEKYGDDWENIREEYNNIDSKHDDLAAQIVECEEQFLGKIRNRSKIKALEEEISNLHKTAPTNGPLINEMFEELTSDNEYVEEMLSVLNKSFDRDWGKFTDLLTKRITQKQTTFQENIEQWNFVKALKEGDSFAIRELLQSRDIFEFMEDYGSSVSVGFNGNVLEVDIFPNTDEAVPKTKRAILKNGALSEKPMAKTEYNLLVQDYICSCILRIANDYFLNLWEESIVINVLETALNPATGNQEENMIISTQIFREPFEKLNLYNLDASDAVEHLGCNMKFSKSNGFSATQIIEVKQPVEEVIEEVTEVVEIEEPVEEVIEEIAEVVEIEESVEEIIEEVAEVVEIEEPVEEVIEEVAEVVEIEEPVEEVIEEVAEVVETKEPVEEEKAATVRRKRFKIESTANVADLNKSLKKFGYQAIVYTAAGNEASDNRKLKTLGGKEYNEINELVGEPVLKNIKALIRKTKVKFKLVKI